MTSDEWTARYKEYGALWTHDGNEKRPHALLTSGNHSNAFINSEQVLEDPLFLDDACGDLLTLLIEQGLDIETVDRVVGPAMGAITMAHDMARHIGRSRSRPCLRAYSEKETHDGVVTHMAFKRTEIAPGERVLVVEDVFNTGGSVERTAQAVIKAGGSVVPFSAILLNRSNHTEFDGRKIVSLIQYPMAIWAPDACPLCAQGSEVLLPKQKENWERLNASY